MKNMTVFNEVKVAYADCGDMPVEKAQKIRNLRFRSSEAVDRDEAVAIMKKCVPGYNEFEPSLLKKLPKGSLVTIAREGSVCVYVQRAPLNVAWDMWSEEALEKLRIKLSADECDPWKNDELRVWWD